MSSNSPLLPRDHYERPHARWLCGRGAEGCPCVSGPTRKGECTVRAECEPIKEGDQWRCARSIIGGGTCEEGPLPDGSCCRHVIPCQPVRSLRSRRKMFVSGCTVLVLGVLMICLSGSKREQFLSTGQLTSAHAGLTADMNCAECHDATEHRVGGWVADFLGFTANGAHAATQSERCLECHQDLATDSFAMHAHNVDPDWLATRTMAKGEKRLGLRELFGSDIGTQGDLDCATCHREHQGMQHDLTAMTNRQCQSCHAESFEGLADGHPDFGAWPFTRRQKIAFDHLRHQNLHFAEQNKNFDCSRCHVDDATQTVKRLAGYDQACASCHDDGIRESQVVGIPFIVLPMIDSQLVSESGTAVEDWPATADGMFDGVIPPLMQLLLREDDDVAEALDLLGPAADFSMIDDLDPKQLQAAGVIANATRQLLEELKTTGAVAIERRLSIALGRELDRQQLSGWLDRVPPYLFAAIAETWFPEPGSVSVGMHLPLLEHVPTIEEARERAAIRNNASFPIPGIAQQREPESLSPTVQGDGVGVASTSSPEFDLRGLTLPASFGQEQELQSEWLAENPLSGLFDDVDNNATQADIANQPDSRQATDMLPSDRQDPSASETAADGANPAQNQGERVVIEKVRLLPSGDWHYDEQTMRLLYRPHGHADAMLKEWIDLLASTPTAKRTPAVAEAINSFTHQNASGRCATCHSIDQPTGSEVRTWLVSQLGQTPDSKGLSDLDWVVNWRADTRDVGIKGFTKFAHRPHLVQPGLADCQSCHQIDPAFDTRSNYDGFDPHEFRAGFLPIGKHACASCHNSAAAGDNCTTCHNYHVHSQADGSTR